LEKSEGTSSSMAGESYRREAAEYDPWTMDVMQAEALDSPKCWKTTGSNPVVDDWREPPVDLSGILHAILGIV
jgi:hypothetical protein